MQVLIFPGPAQESCSVMALPAQLQIHSVHGFTMLSTLQRWEHVERNCDVLEIWAGVGSVAGAARKLSMSAREIELRRIPGITDDPANDQSEDLMSPKGAENTLAALMSVKREGLVMMGPVCSSMVFMNSSRCCRSSDNVWGNETYGPVEEGNHFAKCIVLFLLVCHARGLHAVCEQPKGSYLWKLPPVKLAIEHLNLTSTLTARCTFDRKPFGQRFLKIFKLYGPSWIANMYRTCKCPDGKHEPLVKSYENGTFAGIPEALSASAAYPKAMGKALVQCWLKGKAAQYQNQGVRKRKFVDTESSKRSQSSSSWKQPPLHL